MGWTSPRTWTVGEIVTKAIMDAHVRDNLRYLKGLDGVPTIESGLNIDNTDGDERLLLPLLSTAECSTVLNAEGEVAHDEQTHRIKVHDGTAIRSLVSTADVDDTPANGATTDPISSNWAYDHLNLLTTAGDMAYATAAGVWARLAIGTAGQVLRTNAGATAPEWAAATATKQFFVPPAEKYTGAAVLIGNIPTVELQLAGEYCTFAWRMPNDFASLTSVKISLIPVTTGTFDWTADTDFAANGEAYSANTDTMTADGQAATNNQILELDITNAFTNLGANDWVGCKFTLDLLTTTSSINIIGIDVKYS